MLELQRFFAVPGTHGSRFYRRNGMRKSTALFASTFAVLCFFLFLFFHGNSFAPAGVSVHVDRSVEVADVRIDINTATAEELETLPGIGPVLSAEIIKLREEKGPYQSIDDLLAVPGIGEKKLEAIADMLRFE